MDPASELTVESSNPVVIEVPSVLIKSDRCRHVIWPRRVKHNQIKVVLVVDQNIIRSCPVAEVEDSGPPAAVV